MNKLDLRTPVIYFLLLVIVILLVVIKRISIEEPLNLRSKELIEDQDPLVKEKKYSNEKPKNIRGKIVLIIDDFGYRNDEISDGFLNLNIKITCAVIPGHAHSASFSNKASERGFEIIIHMPMENSGDNKGEENFVLLTNLDSVTVRERIQAAFGQIPQAIGMNNHQGSVATSDLRIMNFVAEVLKEEKKFFIDSRTTPETVAKKVMRLWRVPFAQRNVFLDNDPEEEKIMAQLESLASIAERDGYAVGIGHVKKNTLEVLKIKIPELINEGFVFGNVSKIIAVDSVN